MRAVEDGSPAAVAGVERGDLLVAAGAHELAGVDALYEALDAVSPGETLELTIVRGTDERAVEVRFADREAVA